MSCQYYLAEVYYAQGLSVSQHVIHLSMSKHLKIMGNNLNQATDHSDNPNTHQTNTRKPQITTYLSCLVVSPHIRQSWQNKIVDSACLQDNPQTD